MREEIEMKINDLISLTGFNGNRSAWTEKILALYSDVSKISTSQSFPRVSRITANYHQSQKGDKVFSPVGWSFRPM